MMKAIPLRYNENIKFNNLQEIKIFEILNFVTQKHGNPLYFYEVFFYVCN